MYSSFSFSLELVIFERFFSLFFHTSRVLWNFLFSDICFLFSFFSFSLFFTDGLALGLSSLYLESFFTGVWLGLPLVVFFFDGVDVMVVEGVEGVVVEGVEGVEVEGVEGCIFSQIGRAHV